MRSDWISHISYCLLGGRVWSDWKQYLVLQNNPSNLNSLTTSHDHCARTQAKTKYQTQSTTRRTRKSRKDKWEPSVFVDCNEKVWSRPADGSFEIDRQTLQRVCHLEGNPSRFEKSRLCFCARSAIVYGSFHLITCSGKIPWPDQVMH